MRQGRLLPPPSTVLPLRSIVAAHEALESGHTVGKLVLACGPSLAA
jgi:NADPH:quinone reductase-like Zn-dependent oxidoreductase